MTGGGRKARSRGNQSFFDWEQKIFYEQTRKEWAPVLFYSRAPFLPIRRNYERAKIYCTLLGDLEINSWLQSHALHWFTAEAGRSGRSNPTGRAVSSEQMFSDR